MTARPRTADALLASATDDAWVHAALADVPRMLSDHAHCEKKASASALALINDYPDDAPLVRALTELAGEELGHFREVFERLCALGVTLPRDRGDPYARALLALVRSHPRERKLDRLLVSALIEARSCERFRLLKEELARRGDADLSTWFRRLESSEAGHAALFLHLAEREFGLDAVSARSAELRAREAEIVAALPLESRIH